MLLLSRLPQILPKELFAIDTSFVWTSGAWEEPGWRGFALHRLEIGRSRLSAAFFLWMIIVIWHLPLFFTGEAEWVDVLNMVGGVIVYNWLYHRSGNSVLLVMMIHAMNNAASGEFFSPMFTGVYSVQQAWMRTLVWGVVASIVLATSWRWWTQPLPIPNFSKH